MSAASIDPISSRPSPFAVDCLDGFSQTPKSLPCKWLYDDTGSQWFERITALPGYYLTRTEEALLDAAAPRTADAASAATTVVELGSVASCKTRTLLTAAEAITTYVPIDISADELERAHAGLRADFPGSTSGRSAPISRHLRR